MFSIPPLPPFAWTLKPSDFLASPAGVKWVHELAEKYPHTRYARDRSTCFEMRRLNQFAARIVEAKRAGNHPEFELEEAIEPCDYYWTWQELVLPALTAAWATEPVSTPSQSWFEAIREAWDEKVVTADTSCATDMFDSHDYCEILFRFAQGPYVEDSLICSERNYPSFRDLSVSTDLQFALNNLGYSVSEYRNASGNDRKSQTQLAPRKARRKPIVEMEKLREAVDNACSTSFHIVLYAIIPIRDLLDIDLDKPLTFEKCWVATMDCINGTFHDVPAKGSVTVSNTDGQLITGGDVRWPPSDICGLYTPHYQSRLRNMNETAAAA